MVKTWRVCVGRGLMIPFLDKDSSDLHSQLCWCVVQV